MPNLEGQTLKNRYRIEALIGRGGMAEVYRAWDAHRQYHVAVKVMREDLAEDLEFLRRFKREASALAALAHENIVRFYSFEQERRLAFIVMGYVEGISLRSRIFDAGGEPLPLEEAMSITRQVCAALHYAHTENVLHRDVKPGNIMIQPDGRALVTDFGIAKAADAATATTVMPGTPAYMSPEQCRSELLDERTDVYSLGIVVYEMLAGRRPFVGDTGATTGSTRERLRWEQMHAAPPPPRELNPDIPLQVEAGVLKALAKRREDRWSTPLQFWQAIEPMDRSQVMQDPAELARLGPQPSRVPSSPRVAAPAPAPVSQPAISTPPPQARQALVSEPPYRTRTPSWAWVIGGILVVAVIAFGLALLSQKGIGPSPTVPAIARATTAAPSVLATSLPAMQVTARTPPTAEPIIHIVQSGDTIAGLAFQYDVPEADIITANQLENPSFLQVGAELIIPVGGVPEVTTTLTPAPTPRDTPIPLVPSSADMMATAAALAGVTALPFPTGLPVTNELHIEITEIIAAGQIDQEQVVITNVGDSLADMQGWTLSDADGNTYTFPNLRLWAGGNVMVHTRIGQDGNPPFSFFWGKLEAVWSMGEVATLKTANGEAVASYGVGP